MTTARVDNASPYGSKASCGVFRLLVLRIDFENAEGNLGFANDSWEKKHTHHRIHGTNTYIYLYLIEIYGRCR